MYLKREQRSSLLFETAFMSAFAFNAFKCTLAVFACQKEKEKKCDALLTAGTVFSTPAALTLAAIRCYAAAMDTLLSATCYTHT